MLQQPTNNERFDIIPNFHGALNHKILPLTDDYVGLLHLSGSFLKVFVRDERNNAKSAFADCATISHHIKCHYYYCNGKNLDSVRGRRKGPTSRGGSMAN